MDENARACSQATMAATPVATQGQFIIASPSASATPQVQLDIFRPVVIGGACVVFVLLSISVYLYWRNCREQARRLEDPIENDDETDIVDSEYNIPIILSPSTPSPLRPHFPEVPGMSHSQPSALDTTLSTPGKPRLAPPRPSRSNVPSLTSSLLRAINSAPPSPPHGLPSPRTSRGDFPQIPEPLLRSPFAEGEDVFGPIITPQISPSRQVRFSPDRPVRRRSTSDSPESHARPTSVQSPHERPLSSPAAVSPGSPRLKGKSKRSPASMRTLASIPESSPEEDLQLPSSWPLTSNERSAEDDVGYPVIRPPLRRHASAPLPSRSSQATVGRQFKSLRLPRPSNASLLVTRSSTPVAYEPLSSPATHEDPDTSSVQAEPSMSPSSRTTSLYLGDRYGLAFPESFLELGPISPQSPPSPHSASPNPFSPGSESSTIGLPTSALRLGSATRPESFPGELTADSPVTPTIDLARPVAPSRSASTPSSSPTDIHMHVMSPLPALTLPALPRPALRRPAVPPPIQIPPPPSQGSQATSSTAPPRPPALARRRGVEEPSWLNLSSTSGSTRPNDERPPGRTMREGRFRD